MCACVRTRARTRVARHDAATEPASLPSSPPAYIPQGNPFILDMHIALVKLNNRAGIEVKIRVRTYLISTAAGTRSPRATGQWPAHSPPPPPFFFATFENDHHERNGGGPVSAAVYDNSVFSRPSRIGPLSVFFAEPSVPSLKPSVNSSSMNFSL